MKKLISPSAIFIRGEDSLSLLVKKGDRELLIEFQDGKNLELVMQILDRTRVSISVEELLSGFLDEAKEEVSSFIVKLIELKILINVDHDDVESFVLEQEGERALENYFWEREIAWPDVLRFGKEIFVQIIGLNSLGVLVANFLKNNVFSNIRLIDYPYLKSKNFVEHIHGGVKTVSFDQFLLEDPRKSFVIVADEFGNIPSLLQLNRTMCQEKISFLPLFMFSQIGYMGPLVVPGKTGCFQCFLLSLERVYGKMNVLDASEKEFFEWQEHSSTHPSMIAMLANLLVYQISTNMEFCIKGLTSNLSKETEKQSSNLMFNYANTVTEIDLSIPRIFKRQMVSKPNCPCCRERLAMPKIVFNFTKEYIS